MFHPVSASELEVLVNAFGGLSRAVNVNVDANDEINVESGVRTTPTLVFFRSGEWVPANLKAKWAHAQRFFPTNRMSLQPNDKGCTSSKTELLSGRVRNCCRGGRGDDGTANRRWDQWSG